MRRILPAAMSAILVFTTAPAARAEINIVDSLEWMALDAPLVIRGRVTRFNDTPGPGQVVYRDITVQVQEVLKGGIKDKTVPVRLRLLGSDRDVTGKQWLASGHSFLFFLRPGLAEDDKALAGRWVLREDRQSALDLDAPQRVYTADMKRPKDAAEVLRLARHHAGRKSLLRAVGAPNVFKPQRGYLRLEIPADAGIFAEVFAGSVCYLNVPAEAKHKPLAVAAARSANTWERARGADMLRNFPGADTLKLLKGLLHDPGEATATNQQGVPVEVTYPVRLAAFDALTDLGESPARPLTSRQPTADEIRRVRERNGK
jgi:hypothetical protein